MNIMQQRQKGQQRQQRQKGQNSQWRYTWLSWTHQVHPEAEGLRKFTKS